MKTKPINLHENEAIAAAKGELRKVFRIVKPQPKNNTRVFNGARLCVAQQMNEAGKCLSNLDLSDVKQLKLGLTRILNRMGEFFTFEEIPKNILMADGEIPRMDDKIKCEIIKCPFGVVGDRLWGRERWYMHLNLHNKLIIRYPATDKAPSKTLAPSTMSRKHSRFLFSIEDISVMRIQDVTEEDACLSSVTCWVDSIGSRKHHAAWEVAKKRGLYEGVEKFRPWFSAMWDSLHGKHAWNRNDWVWALTLKDVKEKTNG